MILNTHETRENQTARFTSSGSGIAVSISYASSCKTTAHTLLTYVHTCIHHVCLLCTLYECCEGVCCYGVPTVVEGEGVVKEASPWQPVTTPQPPGQSGVQLLE